MKAQKSTEKTIDFKYGCRREFETPFEETVERTREALKKQGFGVLTEIDMKAKLKEKLDVEIGKYVILGACNPPIAHRALEEDPDIGLLLPCNVIVYENAAGTTVATIDAAKMLSLTENVQLTPVAVSVNEKLRAAINSV